MVRFVGASLAITLIVSLVVTPFISQEQTLESPADVEIAYEAAKDADLIIVEMQAHSEFLASRQNFLDSGDKFWATVLVVMK